MTISFFDSTSHQLKSFVTAVLIANCTFRPETKFGYGDKTDYGQISLDTARVSKDLGLSHDLRQQLC